MPTFSFEKIQKPDPTDEDLIVQDQLENDRFRKGWFGFTNYVVPTITAMLAIGIGCTLLIHFGR